ncbi:MAG: hypothetical protein WCA77_00280, partial [Thermoplasmata archaeon]
ATSPPSPPGGTVPLDALAAGAAGGAAVGAAAGTGASPSPEPPAYVEGPEDFSGPAPEVPAAAAAGGAAGTAAGAAAAEGGEADIDSLMKELDRISTEILKKGPPKTDGGAAGADAGTGTGTQ